MQANACAIIGGGIAATVAKLDSIPPSEIYPLTGKILKEILP